MNKCFPAGACADANQSRNGRPCCCVAAACAAGPPVMLMFERLRVPKDVVRGTNAVCNAVNIRMFVYLGMGMFSGADLVLYIAVSVGAIVGMLLGCLVAARTNQTMFSRMLTALMVLCCALMFASAAGIAGNNTAEQHSSS